MFHMFRLVIFAAISSTLLVHTAPAEARKTGDGIVPAIETVCDGDPYNFGLCNAYCEALDCDSDTPLGTPRACENKLKNYLKHSGGALPPCEAVSCPCNFAAATDFATTVALAQDDFELTSEEVSETFVDLCANLGPNDEFAYGAEASQVVGPMDSAQGVRLFYWVAESETAASCNEEGGGYDGPYDGSPGNWSYGPYIFRTVQLTSREVGVCKTALAELCAGK